MGADGGCEAYVKFVGDVRLVHLFKNCVPSLMKSLGISARSLSWSDIVTCDIN